VDLGGRRRAGAHGGGRRRRAREARGGCESEVGRLEDLGEDGSGAGRLVGKGVTDTWDLHVRRTYMLEERK
jgi:hypothetical protein